MSRISRYQVAISGNVAFAAAGTSTTVVLAAPGVTSRYRVLRLDVALDRAGTASVHGNLLTAGGTFGRIGLRTGQPSDHIYFDEGYNCGANIAVSLFLSASAVANIHYTLAYVTED